MRGPGDEERVRWDFGMDRDERILQRIRDIAGGPKNVTLEDIEWVISQIDAHHDVKRRSFSHGILFRIDGLRFSVCTHHRGSRQLKPSYIRNFLRVMSELGWYDE